eukprot:366496-Chlamydomonas_euryale.AAC.20
MSGPPSRFLAISSCTLHACVCSWACATPRGKEKAADGSGIQWLSHACCCGVPSARVHAGCMAGMALGSGQVCLSSRQLSWLPQPGSFPARGSAALGFVSVRGACTSVPDDSGKPDDDGGFEMPESSTSCSWDSSRGIEHRQLRTSSAAEQVVGPAIPAHHDHDHAMNMCVYSLIAYSKPFNQAVTTPCLARLTQLHTHRLLHMDRGFSLLISSLPACLPACHPVCHCDLQLSEFWIDEVSAPPPATILRCVSWLVWTAAVKGARSLPPLIDCGDR